MSLSSHLDSRSSPVRIFFDERLPNTRLAVRDACSHLRGNHEVAPLRAADGVDPGLSGTAVDFLVRMAVAEDPSPRSSVAMRGARMLQRAKAVSAEAAIEEALEAVALMEPYRRTVSDGEWLLLAQASIVLARFEVVSRSNGMEPAAMVELKRIPQDLAGWIEVLCNESQVEDVAVLGWAAAEDHDDLRGRALRCNPIFARSPDLGGADADIITEDGVLLDFKSTSSPQVCTRRDLLQLCGYALADTEDYYGITAVGLSVLRWRSRVVWDLQELLDEMAGTPVAVSEMRSEFAASCRHE